MHGIHRDGQALVTVVISLSDYGTEYTGLRPFVLDSLRNNADVDGGRQEVCTSLTANLGWWSRWTEVAFTHCKPQSPCIVCAGCNRYAMSGADLDCGDAR